MKTHAINKPILDFVNIASKIDSLRKKTATPIKPVADKPTPAQRKRRLSEVDLPAIQCAISGINKSSKSNGKAILFAYHWRTLCQTEGITRQPPLYIQFAVEYISGAAA